MGRQTKNFRETHSERSATKSYSAYGKYRVNSNLKAQSSKLNFKVQDFKKVKNL